MSEKKGLPKPPLFTSDYILMAEILDFALERFGKLILSLMYYTQDGKEPEDLPLDLKAMFSIYKNKIDAAREKYDKVCVTRAERGAKGGRAKAENAKARSAGQKFKPPTLKQFQEAVAHLADNEEIPDDIDHYEVDSFFDELREANWTIDGEAITSRSDWETIILAKFDAYERDLPGHWYYTIFREIFSKFHGVRDENGRSLADSATSDFVDTYDANSKCWIVRGESFPIGEWKDALARFMEGFNH